MSEAPKVLHDSTAVQAHLSITQSIIQRMASNSSSCKAWCITLVSAILVIVADRQRPGLTLIAYIPTALFLFLDAYYLALERCFRKSYNSFIERLHQDAIVVTDLYVATPAGSVLKSWVSSLTSFSIFPFYILLAVTIWLTMMLLPK